MKRFKAYIQEKIPRSLLLAYKTEKIYRIVARSGEDTEQDLSIARHLVSKYMVFVDIGANIGVYTKNLSPLAVRVISFEPVPFTFAMLDKMVQRFNLGNVEINRLAVSDKKGAAKVFVPLQDGIKNYYRALLPDSITEEPGSLHEVQTDTLDNILEEADPVSLIKCDVEGHELACVKGAQNFLKTQRPAWLIEINSNPDEPGSKAFELFEIMKSFGYSIWLREGRDLKKREKGDMSVNYFFLKEAHIDLLKVKGVALIH